MKKQRNPKETKPEPPYLAVWFEACKIGASVKHKTTWDPKAYTKEPKVYYFPAGFTEQEAIDEIYQEYGERDQQCLTSAHSFAMIHAWNRVGKIGESWGIVDSKVLPIK